jgi:hypothetical protein
MNVVYNNGGILHVVCPKSVRGGAILHDALLNYADTWVLRDYCFKLFSPGMGVKSEV